MPHDGGTQESGTSVFWRGVRIVWRYARREPRVFAISVVGATLYGIAAVASTVVLGRVTDQVIVPGFSHGVEARTVIGGALALFAIGVLRAGSITLRRYFGGLTRLRTQARWRRQITDIYLDVPLDYHRSHPTGQLLAHTDNDVLAATEVISPFPFTLGVIVLIVFALASLALVDIWMMVLALLLFPGLVLLNRAYTKRVERPATEVQEHVGTVSRIVHESFDGALVVKTLGRRAEEVDRVEVAADRLRTSRVQVGRLRGSFEPLLQAMPIIGSILLLGLGSWEISVGRINTGGLVQGIALFSILAFPVQVVGYFLEEIPRSVVATARLDRVAATAPSPGPPAGGGERLPDRPLDVVFDDVSFSYEADQTILDHLSVEIASGEIVALVGSTGAGKTTMCELLVRLIDPTTGSVRIGDVDLGRVDPPSLRHDVALVFQETFLFADTLWENVVLGFDASNDDVRWAMAVAQAERFVAELPMGVATVVGERGVTLSGGQRQRVALARALLRRPRLLILDDATSAVDPVVESQILDGLRRDLDTTTIVVAQRISTIELADRVVFLDGGRVAAQGAHRDLLASVPGYARIVRAYESATAP